MLLGFFSRTASKTCNNGSGTPTRPIGPNRVNRAHWPTKENKQNVGIFLIFLAHAKNGPRWVQMGPGGFFPTNPDLADNLGDMVWVHFDISSVSIL